MFCNQCGHANAEGAKFCSTCGGPLLAMAGVGVEGALAQPARAARSQPGCSDFDEEAWRAVIGPAGADYYLPRFRTMAAGGSAGRWHWPAFFVTWYWMLYRRMWGLALLYLVSPYIIGLVIGVAAAISGARNQPLQGVVALVVGLAYLLAPPVFANSWYFRHCQAVMAKMKARTRSREGYLGALEAKGGTGSAVLVLVAVVGVVAIIGILAAIALPAYQDYTQRVKVTAAAQMGRATANAVIDSYRRTGQIPATLDQLQAAPPKPVSVGMVAINPKTGEVDVQVLGIGMLRLVPQVRGNEFAVQCSSPDIRPRLLPRDCRQTTL